MTIGEDRVRLGFNPSNNADVEIIKAMTAEIINRLVDYPGIDERLSAIAQEKYEGAAMWAVKAVTA